MRTQNRKRRFRTEWVSSVPWLPGLEGIEADHYQAIYETRNHPTVEDASSYLLTVDDYYGAPRIYEEEYTEDLDISAELGRPYFEWEEIHSWEMNPEDGSIYTT